MSDFERFPSRPEFREPDHPGSSEMLVTICLICTFIIVPLVALILYVVK